MELQTLRILEYPHPALRHVSKPLKRVDAELLGIVRQMFDLMYAHRGIGLAANQVGLPYRMFVLNLTSDPAETGEELVFLNPVISHPKGTAEAEEGCLSLPGLFCEVKRPETVHISAYNLQGEELNYQLDGLFARAAQHENDHLDGVLFIDRLDDTKRLALKEGIEEFELQFASRREHGEIPPDEEIAAQLARLEQLRT